MFRFETKCYLPDIKVCLNFQMFMKAVMESLKDLETGNAHVEEPCSHVGSKLLEPHEKNDSFSTLAKSIKTVSTSAATCSELTPPSEAGINIPRSDISTCDYSTPDDLANHPKATAAAANNPNINDTTPSPSVAERNETASRGDTQPGNQSSSDTDVADHTRVTVKVVKTPTTNIMDGLFRRWDLNFFKNR